MPSTPPVSAPQSVVGLKSLGAIPKTTTRQPPPPPTSSPPPPPPQQPEIPRAMTTEVTEAEEEEGEAPDEVIASPGLGKRSRHPMPKGEGRNANRPFH